MLILHHQTVHPGPPYFELRVENNAVNNLISSKLHSQLSYYGNHNANSINIIN